MENKLKEYLKQKNCRGCYNRCPLSNPMCGRSKIFIKEETEKFRENEKSKIYLEKEVII